MASVSFRALEKRFGALRIVKGIDLEISDGEFVVLVGPSGCGKSTTLRMVAGLEPVSAGEIWIGPRVVNDLPPRARDVAMVFQDYALYPHKSVFENMAFGLRARRLPQPEIAARIRQASEMLGIGHLLDRMPRALSGGQRQRVAMGRAIVRDPKVFLFDEPLSNLDAKLRGQVRAEIKKLHQAIGTTIVYVTHDQVEAMTLADRIVIMRAGAIEQVGTPDELYGNPASMFVAGFVGSPAMNFLHGRLGGGGITLTDGSVLALPPARLPRRAAGDIVLGLRPEHVVEGSESTPGLSGRVEVVEPLGADTLVHLRIGDATVVCRMPPQIRPEPGSTLRVGVDPARLSFFDPATDARLS